MLYARSLQFKTLMLYARSLQFLMLKLTLLFYTCRYTGHCPSVWPYKVTSINVRAVVRVCPVGSNRES
jgi:hypothetical protein